jgi:uncharacterized DUF497 family protein
MADDSSALIFEWDENKRRANVSKHRIDFADAATVFLDPSARTYQSPRPNSEPRYIKVGMARGMLIAVIFTRRREAIRIISARVARRSERKLYG